ncbi:MAG TPA: hypothetical protein VGF13_07860 [Verrucomicrobiae bacterium]|jgi:hypothetical protein
MDANPPPYFKLRDGYASYHPVGEISFDEAVRQVAEAISYARESAIRKLFVDTTLWTGFPSPDTMERYSMAETFARAARSKVILAMVARPEMIDANRFGVTVARNRGLICNVFESKEEAIPWLTNPDVK